MKKILFLFIGILFFSCSKYDSELIESEIITATDTNYEFKVFYALPADYSEDKVYQTVYVLDGNQWHDDAANITEEVYEETGEEVIIVGIGYDGKTKRTRDYSPTEWMGDSKGEVHAFFNFIQNDLIPHVETLYNVGSASSDRHLMGHSLGGAAVVYGFIHFNTLFDNYIAMSPAVLWDDLVLFEMEEEQRVNNSTFSGHIILTAGSYESGGMISAASLFEERVANHYPNASTSFEVIDSQGHIGVIRPAMKLGLTFTLNH